MRIIAKRTLRRFWESHARHLRARTPLERWYAQARKANWAAPADVKREYGDASVLHGGRVVFNIGGNRFRLVVRIDYRSRTVYVRFVGTHEEYDEIDATTI